MFLILQTLGYLLIAEYEEYYDVSKEEYAPLLENENDPINQSYVDEEINSLGIKSALVILVSK
jgi:hypothetical protein